jgi:oligosaccharyltransferase complex subunit alpha (ribophorin I)
LRGEIESYTHGEANTDGQPDPTKSGSVLTYGPYDVQKPTTAFEEVKIHFEYTAPIAYVEQLERDIEVSHWGNNVAIEERYILGNHAARSSYSSLQSVLIVD